jgi:hypothetical protein
MPQALNTQRMGNLFKDKLLLMKIRSLKAAIIKRKESKMKKIVKVRNY